MNFMALLFWLPVMTKDLAIGWILVGNAGDFINSVNVIIFK